MPTKAILLFLFLCRIPFVQAQESFKSTTSKIKDIKLFKNSLFETDRDRYDRMLSSRKIELDYDENVITFIWSIDNELGSTNQSFAYILEGFEYEWNYCGTEIKSRYTNLEPGEYRFKLKSSINDNWSEQEDFINVTIIPPFWGTVYFKLIPVGVFLLLVFSNLSMRRKIRRLEQQAGIKGP